MICLSVPMFLLAIKSRGSFTNDGVSSKLCTSSRCEYLEMLLSCWLYVLLLSNPAFSVDGKKINKPSIHLLYPPTTVLRILGVYWCLPARLKGRMTPLTRDHFITGLQWKTHKHAAIHTHTPRDNLEFLNHFTCMFLKLGKDLQTPHRKFPKLGIQTHNHLNVQSS